MARTPLLRTFQRLYRQHRAARALGLPLDACRERATLSRRTFLAGAGAAGVGALTGSLPAAARPVAAQPKIVIVGAGIAGLNCALSLRDQGIASTVYEAAGRVGGRM